MTYHKKPHYEGIIKGLMMKANYLDVSNKMKSFEIIDAESEAWISQKLQIIDINMCMHHNIKFHKKEISDLYFFEN